MVIDEVGMRQAKESEGIQQGVGAMEEVVWKNCRLRLCGNMAMLSK